jgi:hypothetical protein
MSLLLVMRAEPSAVVRRSFRQLSEMSLRLLSENLGAAPQRRIGRRMWRATSHFSAFERGWSVISANSAERGGMAT